MERIKNESVSRVDRKIFSLFDEIDENVGCLRELIRTRGQQHSSLCWFAPIRHCEHQIHKLFVTTFGSEVSFRHEQDVDFDNNIDEQ